MTEAVEDQRTVFGRPISGDFTEPYQPREDQWPDEQFLPLLDAVLNVEGVEAVRWTQATPYFNDGEPCVFRLGEMMLKMINQDEDGDYGDGYLSSYSLYDYKDHKKVPASGYESVYEPFQALMNACGHFETFLQKTFGDHATITATKDGFDVEFYEHG